MSDQSKTMCGIRTLSDLTETYAESQPDKTAMIYEGRKTTYLELHHHSNQIANGFIKEQLKPMDRVVYLGKNTDSYYELLLGCYKANTILCPLNWRLAPAELEAICKDAQPSMVFIEEEFCESLKNYLISKHIKTVFIDKKKQQMTVTDIFENWRNNQSAESPLTKTKSDQIVLLMYTSGTTGVPKGVQITNEALFFLRRSEEQVGGWAKWQSTDISLVAMPVFHIGGTAWGFTGLYNGATSVIMRQAEPVEFINLIETYKVKKLFAVPALLLFITQYKESTPERFKHVDVVLYGASPIPEDLLKASMALFDAEFVQLYGMTEAAGSMTYLPPNQHLANGQGRLKSCGKPLPGVEIKIINDNGKHQPQGAVGEILIKSPSLMAGYWNRQEETEKAIKGEWYYSGDAGYLDEEGYLYIYDRVKDMIVSGGENIYPAEVETVLFSHTGIDDVAVIGVPSDKWGEFVKAIVVRKEGFFPSEEQLIAYCRSKLGGYKVPKSIEFVNDLPRNPSGKLLKKELRQRYWKGKNRMVN